MSARAGMLWMCLAMSSFREGWLEGFMLLYEVGGGLRHVRILEVAGLGSMTRRLMPPP